MMKPMILALLAFAAIAIGSSILAWRQYKELVELRAAAMHGSERIDYENRLHALQQQNRDLADRLALRDLSTVEEPLADRSSDEERAESIGGGRRGGGPGAMRGLMNNPQAQALRSIQQQSMLDARYAALFKNLNLTPEQLAKFRTLLSERQSTTMDVMAAARQQGLDPAQDQEQLRALLKTAQAGIDSSIKSAIGDNAFAQYLAYEETALQRNTVRLLEQRLSFTDSPITPAQSDQLVQILAAPTTGAIQNAPPAYGFGGGPGGGMGGAGPTAPITATAITQAQNVLNPTQLAALQELQRQQAAQQQLHDMMQNDESTTPNPAGGTVGARPRGGG
jgi:chorismate mutase